MRTRIRSFGVFSLSAIDLFASAMGAFIIISLILMPDYQKEVRLEGHFNYIEQLAREAEARLDESEQGMQERLEALRRDGMTVLMTTHYLHEAEACDRVAIIDAGRVVALGAPAELVAETAGARDLEDVFIALTGHQLRDQEASPRALMKGFARRGGELTR